MSTNNWNKIFFIFTDNIYQKTYIVDGSSLITRFFFSSLSGGNGLYAGGRESISISLLVSLKSFGTYVKFPGGADGIWLLSNSGATPL
jgi:hypothetical protein